MTNICIWQNITQYENQSTQQKDTWTWNLSSGTNTEQNIDSICIQEHWPCCEKTAAEVTYLEVTNRWMFAFSSAKKNDANASIGGIGMLISPSACQCLSQVPSTEGQLQDHDCNFQWTSTGNYHPLLQSDKWWLRRNQVRVLWLLSNCHNEHSNPQCHNCSWWYEC